MRVVPLKGGNKTYHQPLLDIRTAEPRLHGKAAEHKINTRPEIPRSRVNFLLPMGVHALSLRMKASADIPHHWPLPPFVTISKHRASLQELVEYPAIRCGHIFFVCDALLLHVLFSLCSVKLFPGDVKVSANDHTLSLSDQVSYSGVEGTEEAIAEVVPHSTRVCRTVYSKKDEGGKFEDDAATFGVEGRGVDFQASQLLLGQITTDVKVGRKIAIGCGGVGGAENTKEAFLGSDWSAGGIASVNSYTRVS